MTAAAARSSRPRDSLTQIALQRGTRCSAGRDVFFILAGAQLPCSIQGTASNVQGTASNVACGYFTLSRSGVKGKAPDLPGIVNASSSQGMDLAPTPWQSFASLVRHPGYAQQFWSRLILHISDHLIPGLV